MGALGLQGDVSGGNEIQKDSDLECEYNRWKMITKWANTIFADANRKFRYEKTALLERFLITAVNNNKHPEIDPIFGSLINGDDKTTMGVLTGDSAYKNISIDSSKVMEDIMRCSLHTSDKYKTKCGLSSDTIHYRDFTMKIPQELLKFRAFDLCKVALRYSCFPMSGQFWALPSTIYRYLNNAGGVILEGFASPFNSQVLKNGINAPFCSMFKDTDAVFGSIGNFFDLRDAELDLTKKYFLINPPYIEDIIRKVIVQVELLHQKHKDKTIVMILPNWEDIIGGIRFTPPCHIAFLEKFTYKYDILMEDKKPIKKSFKAPFDSRIYVLGDEKAFDKIVGLIRE